MRATAVRDGAHYVLNGEKNWVTSGAQADLFIVFAKTDPSGGTRGISAFIVEKGTPGLTVGKPEKKMGIKASETVSISLEDCRVPAENLLGPGGDGFQDRDERSWTAAGSAWARRRSASRRAALERSVKYAQEREAFGKPIAEFAGHPVDARRHGDAARRRAAAGLPRRVP